MTRSRSCRSSMRGERGSRTAKESRQDGNCWVRLVESCVGAHLLNPSFGTNIEPTYWRERNHKVDFILRQGRTTGVWK